MKPIIVYVYPNPKLVEKAQDYALRFIETYHQRPPGIEHETIVTLNALKVNSELKCLFSSLQKVRFLEHDDSGWDIGAFQRASGENPNADLMVFFGTSVYLKNSGWLIRMVNAAKKYGDGLYGCMGNSGIPTHKVYPHVRTTGFWIKPSLMNKYPHRITRADQRYEFEHGRTCLAEWLRKEGYPTWVVTANGEYARNAWDSIPNGYHRGDQSAMLCGDRLTCPPYYVMC